MSVSFDNTTFLSAGGIATITTGAFTIAGTNRAGLLGLTMSINTATGITGSIGGVSGTLVTGTDSGTASASRTMIFGVTAPPTGSQTATMSWTTNSIVTLGVATAQVVNQTTPLNNGTFTTTAASPLSISINSNSGDLTCDTAGVIVGVLSAPTQTSRWNDTASNYGAGSTGPGTAGPITHQWTVSVTETDPISGANFNQLSAVAPSGPPLVANQIYIMG